MLQAAHSDLRSPRHFGEVYPYRMRNEWLGDRLKALRPKGKTARGLAEALHISAPRISEMIQGDRDISAREVSTMADYLEMHREDVLDLISIGTVRPTAPMRPVAVIGAVQAGVWREAVEWPEDRRYTILAAPDPRYRGIQQFGLEVVGPSMNEVYPEGTVVICVSLIHLGRDPRPGERVVCTRTADAGIEATVKELRQDTAGVFWLWPRSTDPNFQQPWPLNTEDAFDNEQMRVTALVIGSYRPEA